MPARRQSAAELPRAPLELVHPLAIQGGAVAGAEILSDGLGPTAVLLFRLHRALLAWTADPESPPAFDRAALRRIEDSLLSRLRKDEIAAPLAILTSALLEPETVEQKRLAWACLCISDWAIGQGATATALAFAQLAALCWPRHARYSWIAGRMYRGRGDLSRAEAWLKRAYRVAVWTDDWETQTRSLLVLGNVSYRRGNFSKADARLTRALSVARRNGLKTLEGEVLHDLFVISFMREEFERAEVYGSRALAAYSNGHPRLTALVFDFAVFWMMRGYFARALPLLRELRARFAEPELRMQVATATARAAGACGEADLFAAAWDEAWSIFPTVRNTQTCAACLLDLGRGGASLGDWEKASQALTLAVELAAEEHEGDVLINAEAALDSVKRMESAERVWKRTPGPDRSAVDSLADRLLEAARVTVRPC